MAGFLKDNGPQHLADVDIACRNQYATIVVVPLDGRPIRESGKVLIQVGTVCRPTGWAAVPTRARINGKTERLLPYHFRRRNARSKWRTRRPRSRSPMDVSPRAVLLDVNGMATQTPVELKQAAGKATVVLPANTMYLVLQ